MHRAATCLLALLCAPALRADDWPQWLGPNRDGVWRETGITSTFPPAGGPKVVWRTPVNQGYAGPAVSGGRVYVTDWTPDRGGRPGLSAFQRGQQPGPERLLCLDQASGKLLWQHEYPTTYSVSYAAGPRTTPTIDAGRVYTVGTMGDLVCLDATTGNKVWSKNYVSDYKAAVPIWGFSSPPVVEGDLLICLVGGPASLVVAFDKLTGKEVWKALEDGEPGYAPPVVFDAGGLRQLVVWHPSAVSSLDPKTGKLYWQEKFGPLKAALAIPTPRLTGDRLFLTAFYNGSLMLRLASDRPAAEVLWKVGGKNERAEFTKALHSIMVTPFFTGNHVYGIDSYGELRCLDASTGERVWSSMQATGPKSERWGNAFLVRQGDTDRYWLFNEHGELILATLTSTAYTEVGRAKLVEPTNRLAGRPVVWTYPAFAGRCAFVRNDKELVCVSLAGE
jgi:outer membrane protein assembly factor BamB